MIAALTLSALSLGSITANGRTMDLNQIPGSYDYAEASIAVDPNPALGYQSAWIGSMSMADGGSLIQIGWWWWSQGQEAIPFVQVWNGARETVNPIINFPQPVGGNEHVALSTVPGTSNWTAWLRVGSTMVPVWSGNAGVSAGHWEGATEAMPGTALPEMCYGAGLGNGVFTPNS